MRARNVDHITLAVRDPDAAIELLGAFGFVEGHVALIDGGEPAAYMGMPTMEADHITLVLEGSDPRVEVQLLHFRDLGPDEEEAGPTSHRRLGFNHLALRVDDLSTAAAELADHGVVPISEQMHYISRRLQMFAGPEGITLELVEWVDP